MGASINILLIFTLNSLKFSDIISFMFALKTPLLIKVLVLLLFSLSSLAEPPAETTAGCSYEKVSSEASASNAEDCSCDSEENDDDVTTSPNKFIYKFICSSRLYRPKELRHKSPFLEQELRPPRTRLS